MTEEKYIFQAATKKKLVIVGIVGILLFVAGIVLFPGAEHHGEEHALISVENTDLVASSDETPAATEGHDAHAEEAHHGSSTLVKNIYSNLWVNNVYFAGLAIIGLFFIAIQYAAQAGWSAGIKRVPLAMATWLPIAGVLMLVSWFVVGHDVFHWTHLDLFKEGSDTFDKIINAKKGMWYWPLTDNPSAIPVFFIGRMVLFFGVWYLFFVWIKKQMLAEDLNGGVVHWKKARTLSAVFLVFFGYSSSIAAWDWVMSIDTHWFSTMFGWYVFASWWVTGLSVIALIVVMLKEAGYMKIVNSNHIHDLGKFIFGFSIFWTYIWFSQFMLIYYANIPEETVYFIERLSSSNYVWIFFLNLILNFLLPFLLLMTRDAKRHMSMIKVVTPIIIVGHWFDFYLMVTPGVMQNKGGFGLMEIGMFLIFAVVFLFVTLSNLAKVPLIAKNHPMLEESLDHHI